LAEEQLHTDGEQRESLVGRAQQQMAREGAARSTKVPEVDKEGEEDWNGSDSEDDDADLPEAPAKERQLRIMRTVMRKWRRVAGLPGHADMCEQKGDEFAVPWTRGIAPRLEGRIRMVGDGVVVA
jgi:hypothetical protein